MGKKVKKKAKKKTKKKRVKKAAPRKKPVRKKRAKKKAEASKDPLSAFERCFLLEWIKCGYNGSRAYLRLRPGTDEAAAASCACRLLRSAKMRSEIIKWHEARGTSSDQVVTELHGLAFFDPLDLFDDEGHLRAIKEMPREARKAIASMDVQVTQFDDKVVVTVTKIKMVPKIRALELLGRHLGTFDSKPEDTDELERLLVKACKRIGVDVPDGDSA